MKNQKPVPIARNPLFMYDKIVMIEFYDSLFSANYYILDKPETPTSSINITRMTGIQRDTSKLEKLAALLFQIDASIMRLKTYEGTIELELKERDPQQRNFAKEIGNKAIEIVREWRGNEQ